MSEAGERRRAARKHVHIEVEYRAVGSLLVDPVRDISQGGLFLASKSPLPLGTSLEVVLRSPAGSDPLRLKARVVRVVWGGRRQGKPIEPGMALAFVTLSPTEEQRLAELLETSETTGA